MTLPDTMRAIDPEAPGGPEVLVWALRSRLDLDKARGAAVTERDKIDITEAACRANDKPVLRFKCPANLAFPVVTATHAASS